MRGSGHQALREEKKLRVQNSTLRESSSHEAGGRFNSTLLTPGLMFN